MIEVKVNKGDVELAMEGHRRDILAEIPIAFGTVLSVALDGCPEGLKEELIKGVFECVLREIRRVENA